MLRGCESGKKEGAVEPPRCVCGTDQDCFDWRLFAEKPVELMTVTTKTGNITTICSESALAGTCV